MDFILSFPEEDTIFIGLFMMDSKESGKGKGSAIIAEAFTTWKSEGYKKSKAGLYERKYAKQELLEKMRFYGDGSRKRK